MKETAKCDPRDPSGEALGAAFDVFDSFRGELVRLLKEVKQGETASARKLAPAVMDLSKALGTMLREHQRIQELRGIHEGDLHQHSLDLAEARDEVGRRMARLRAAGRAESVPGTIDRR